MTTKWNPQPYIEHFGTVEHMASALGIQPRAMRQQVRKNRINKQAKAYLDNIMVIKQPVKRNKPAFKIGEITQEFIEAIKTHGTKYKLSFHYGVRTQRLNAHLNACFGHQDLQKVKEMFK